MNINKVPLLLVRLSLQYIKVIFIHKIIQNCTEKFFRNLKDIQYTYNITKNTMWYASTIHKMCMYMHCTKNCQEFKPSHRCLEYQYLVHSFTNTGFSSPNPLIRYYYKNNNSSKNNNLLVLNKKQSSQLTLFFNECIILQVKQITYWMLIFYSLRIKQLCSTYNFFFI